jgi:hypothetical protein
LIIVEEKTQKKKTKRKKTERKKQKKKIVFIKILEESQLNNIMVI